MSNVDDFTKLQDDFAINFSKILGIDIKNQPFQFTSPSRAIVRGGTGTENGILWDTLEEITSKAISWNFDGSSRKKFFDLYSTLVFSALDPENPIDENDPVTIAREKLKPYRGGDKKTPEWSQDYDDMEKQLFSSENKSGTAFVSSKESNIKETWANVHSGDLFGFIDGSASGSKLNAVFDFLTN